jgi:hypothetical protein
MMVHPGRLLLYQKTRLEGLGSKNGLAFYELPQITVVKSSFITLCQWASLMTLYTVVINYVSKLVRLSRSVTSTLL